MSDMVGMSKRSMRKRNMGVARVMGDILCGVYVGGNSYPSRVCKRFISCFGLLDSSREWEIEIKSEKERGGFYG